jgi:hypothetical protein
MEEAWHYTSLEACIKILETREIWFANIMDTNDSSECKHAYKVLEEYFSPVFKNFMQKNKDRYAWRVKGTQKEKLIREEMIDRLKVLFDALVGEASKFHGSLFCLSKRCALNGDDGRLSMWRGYGTKALPARPVAIVFNAKKLERAFLDSKVKNELRYYGEVTYAKNHTDVEKSWVNILRFYTRSSNPLLPIGEKLFQMMNRK